MMITLKFMNNKDAQLTPECEAELFRGMEWGFSDTCDEDEANQIHKRRITANIDRKDAVAFSGTIFYGHVLVTQYQRTNLDEKVVGLSTNIVPMDDAKLKILEGRSGYYGTGKYSVGSSLPY